jgi:hypothetical protein
VEVGWFVGFAVCGGFEEAGVLAFYLDSCSGFGGDVFYVGALGLDVWDRCLGRRKFELEMEEGSIRVCHD